MIWVFTGVLTVILVELFLRLPLISTARGIGNTARKAARALSARGVSDHWKEKVSQAYAGKMARATLILAGGLGLIGIVGTLFSLGVDMFAPGFSTALLSWTGLVVSFAVATVYVILRSKFVRG